MTGAFDILILGAGPAGLSAAVAAASAGKRVVLVDENFHAGGQIWHSGPAVGNTAPSIHPAAAKQLERLRDYSVTFLRGWRVFTQPAANVLRAERNRDFLDLSYEKLILATGAREHFLPFPGWTLPNIVGVGGLQSLSKSGLSLKDKHIVLAGSGPLLLAVAAYARQHGARVEGIFEQTSARNLARFAFTLGRHPQKILQGLGYRWQTFGVPYRTSCWPVEAFGEGRVKSVRLTDGRKEWEIPCDYLACAFNLVPNSELASLLGCQTQSDPQPGCVSVDEWQQTSVPHVYCAGEPTGIGGLELSRVEGEIAGFAAAEKLIHAERLFAKRRKLQHFAQQLEQCFALRPELRSLAQPETILCRCEDVALKDIQEHSSWRSAKLHTRCGMGPCQGRICGPATEYIFGWSATSIRPPVFPAYLSSLGAIQSHSEAQASQTQEAQ